MTSLATPQFTVTVTHNSNVSSTTGNVPSVSAAGQHCGNSVPASAVAFSTPKIKAYKCKNWVKDSFFLGVKATVEIELEIEPEVELGVLFYLYFLFNTVSFCAI